jgi:bifunctional non-homologous end joining protein LigD
MAKSLGNDSDLESEEIPVVAGAHDNPVIAEARPRFVIQKHDAAREHYELRLEIAGVFKTWAVTRGPSFDPDDKRLAVQVGDHLLDADPVTAGNFDETVQQGSYGGGSVVLWDYGHWRLDGDTAPEEALQAGELHITLEGRRLKGGWALLRMKSNKKIAKPVNWLLIKDKDRFAS